MLRNSVAALAALFLAAPPAPALAGVAALPVQAVPAPPPGDAAATLKLPGANIVFFRDHAQPTLWGVTLSVDGTKVISLGENRYTGIHLAPGEHFVAVKWAGHTGQASGGFTLIVEEGEPLFLEVVGNYGPLQLQGFGKYSFIAQSGLIRRDPAEAVSAIGKCCTLRMPAKEWLAPGGALRRGTPVTPPPGQSRRHA